MIRFGTKTLLFAFLLVALWCSTFSGYSAGHDVRASVLLIVFLSAGYAAVYSRGRSRAFWSGVFIVMLLMGGNLFQGPVNKYVPNFLWRTMQPIPTMAVQYSAPPQVVYPQPVQPYRSSGSIQPIPPMVTSVAVTPVTVSNYEFMQAVNDTIAIAWTLVLGSVAGLVGVWVYAAAAAKSTGGSSN